MQHDGVSAKRSVASRGAVLAFARIKCRCGVARVRGVRCPDCGAKPDPREVDQYTVTRRAAIALAREALHRETVDIAVESDPRVTVSIIQDGLLRFVDGLTPSLDAASSEPLLLRSLATDLNAMVTIARAAPKLRPWIVVLRLLSDVAEGTRACLDRYLDALAAPTPLEAQAAAQAGQAALDRLTQMISPLGDLLDAIQPDDTDAPGRLIGALARAIAAIRPTATIIEHDTAGAALFKAITGRVGCPLGLGIVLEMLHQDVMMTGDPDRFIETARQIHAQLTRNAGMLDAVLDDPDWRARMRQASTDLFNDSAIAITIIATAARDEQKVQAVVDYVHNVVEAGSRPLVDLLAVSVTGQPLSKVRGRNATISLKHLRDRGLDEWLIGLSEPVRNAKAHRTYRVKAESLEVLDRSGNPVVDFSYPELADLALAAGETIAILSAATLCAAASDEAGIDDLLAPTNLLPPTETIAGCAIMHGLSVTGVEMDEAGRVIVVVTNESLNVNRAAGAAFMTAKLLPTTVEVMQINGGDGRRLDVPLEGVRSWQPHLDNTEMDVELLSRFRRMTLDGLPSIDRESFRSLIARQAAPMCSRLDVKDIPRLRQLVAAAKEDQDDRLATGLQAVATALRMSITGGQLTASEQAALADLAAFVALPVATEIL